MVAKNLTNSCIGPGSFFEGKFFVSGSLRIDGKFEGEIKTGNTLVVGRNGKIKTNVHVKNAIVEGTMIGNIHAQNLVRLEPTGKVLGDINTPVIQMAPGVVVKGSINITGNNKKNTKVLIQETYDESTSSSSTKSKNEKKSSS